MSTVATRKLTADEFFEVAPECGRSELIRGEVIRLAPATSGHGIVAMRIGARLAVFVEAHDLGYVFAAETGFVLARDPDTVRAPDAAFVSRDREPAREEFVPFAPDLAVEVVSPDDRPRKVQEKVKDWLAAGARRVWVLYPRTATVHVHSSPTDVRILRHGDVLADEELLPGFAVLLAELFR